MNEDEVLNEDLEESPQEEGTEEIEDTSIDYTTYLQDIIDNQNTILSNQETLIYQNDVLLRELGEQTNALKGITNIVVLTCIVVCGVWIVKNIFIKMM